MVWLMNIVSFLSNPSTSKAITVGEVLSELENSTFYSGTRAAPVQFQR